MSILTNGGLVIPHFTVVGDQRNYRLYSNNYSGFRQAALRPRLARCFIADHLSSRWPTSVTTDLGGMDTLFARMELFRRLLVSEVV